MPKFLKMTAIPALFALSLFSFTFAAEDSVTITTYYPSPFGTYKELRLYPNDQESTCNASKTGAMYYDESENQTKVCDGSAWQVLGGTPQGAVMFFNLSSCPSGWSELTTARGRYMVGLPSGGTLGATAGTALSNGENRATGSHSHNVTISPWLTSTISGAGCTTLISGCSSPQYALRTDMGNPLAGTADAAGSGSGTNAPYVQLLACQKN